MGADDYRDWQRISRFLSRLHIAPEMASASHVECVPVLIDDLDASETHVDRFRAERISCNGESGGDVSPKSSVGAITGVMLDNGKAVQVDIFPLENSFLDWSAFVRYLDFAL